MGWERRRSRLWVGCAAAPRGGEGSTGGLGWGAPKHRPLVAARCLPVPPHVLVAWPGVQCMGAQGAWHAEACRMHTPRGATCQPSPPCVGCDAQVHEMLQDFYRAYTAKQVGEGGARSGAAAGVREEKGGQPQVDGRGWEGGGRRPGEGEGGMVLGAMGGRGEKGL